LPATTPPPNLHRLASQSARTRQPRSAIDYPSLGYEQAARCPRPGPGPSLTPMLASANDAMQSRPVLPRSARSEVSWSQSRSQGRACGALSDARNWLMLAFRAIIVEIASVSEGLTKPWRERG
jgi:hypothetical protein